MSLLTITLPGLGRWRAGEKSHGLPGARAKQPQRDGGLYDAAIPWSASPAVAFRSRRAAGMTASTTMPVRANAAG